MLMLRSVSYVICLAVWISAACFYPQWTGGWIPMVYIAVSLALS
jgi:hypothetical protein